MAVDLVCGDALARCSMKRSLVRADALVNGGVWLGLTARRGLSGAYGTASERRGRAALLRRLRGRRLDVGLL